MRQLHASVPEPPATACEPEAGIPMDAHFQGANCSFAGDRYAPGPLYEQSECSTNALRVFYDSTNALRMIYECSTSAEVLYECFRNALRILYESRSVLRVFYENIESSTRVYERSTNGEVLYECFTSALRVGCIQNVHKAQPRSTFPSFL